MVYHFENRTEVYNFSCKPFKIFQNLFILFAQEKMNVEGYVFLLFLLASFIVLIVAETTNYWTEFGPYGSSYNGLWNVCFVFVRSKTKICNTLDDVSGTYISLIEIPIAFKLCERPLETISL